MNPPHLSRRQHVLHINIFNWMHIKQGRYGRTSINTYRSSSWRIGGESGDPYPEHKPDDFNCPSTSFRIESNQLEIEMDTCNYAHVVFESNQKVKAGKTVGFDSTYGIVGGTSCYSMRSLAIWNQMGTSTFSSKKNLKFLHRRNFFHLIDIGTNH